MARSADLVVYAIAGVSAVLGAMMVGADPGRLALIALAVSPLVAEAAGARVHPVPGAIWSLAPIGVLQLVNSPKPVMLIPTATAAWVALRSSSFLVNAAVLIAGSVLSVLHFYWYSPPLAGDYISSGSIIWVAAITYGTATGLVLRRAGELAAELAQAQSRLVAVATANERRRIAQDVHDLVAHSLAVALLNITGARKTMGRDPLLADEALARAEAVGRESLDGIRKVVGLLREDAGGGFGSGPLPDAHDLAELVAGYRRSGLDVDLRVAGSLEDLDPVAGSVLFRTVREGLANVLHHADGAATEVRVDVDGAGVSVVVHNDLPTGWQPRWDSRRDRAGMGLTGIAERVHALGGFFRAGEGADCWRLEAVIPTTGADAADAADEADAAAAGGGRTTSARGPTHG